MIRSLLSAALLVIAAPAFAQNADAPAPAPLPTPEEAARQLEPAADAMPAAVPAAASTSSSGDPPARPYFVKGELVGTAVRPLTRRNFLGASGGISALPATADTVLNNFYFTVEPQLDLRSQLYQDLRVGLGVPLQFELYDARGAFERCLAVARDAKQSGASQDMIVTATGDCIEAEKGNATENFGRLRAEDWDETSDFAKVIRYVTIGGEERPFYLNVSRIYGHSVAHGTAIRRYNPNLDYNTARVGVTFDAYHRFIGFESMVNDMLDPDVLGLLAFVRPFEPAFSHVLPLRNLSFGASVAVGLDAPRLVAYEPGLFEPSVDKPIPRVDSDLNPVVVDDATVTILGFDVETKLIRTQNADLKVYFDVQQILDHGRGFTLGTLWRFSFGRPATMALRIRAEGHLFDPDYLPSYFDSFYDVQKLQYLPAGYFSGAVAYYPTKLAYLEANAGGKQRLGGYFEATHTFVNLLTVGLAVRGSVGIGQPRAAGFQGPQFTNYDACGWQGERLDCAAAGTVTVAEPGYGSLLLYGEIPFRRFLQAFISYEAFSTSLNAAGLDLFELDGDNEVLFAGARLQLLPVLFVQAEARRFYFLQRITNVDLDNLRMEQDQNFHSEWTFALNLYAGYEF